MQPDIDEVGRQLGQMLDRAASWFFAVPFWALVIGALAHGILTNGLWNYVVATELREVATGLGTPVLLDKPQEQWVMYSTLGPAIAHYTGFASSSGKFLAMHLAVFLSVYLLGFWYIHRRFGDGPARVALGALFLTTFFNVLLTWLGSMDPFTFAYVLIVTFGWRQPLIVAPAALAMSVNHAEQGLVITAVLTTYLVLSRDRSDYFRITLFLVASIVGLGAGRAALEAWYTANEIGPQMSRMELRSSTGSWEYLRSASGNIWAFFFSAFGLFWPALILMMASLKGSRLVRAFALSCLLAAGAANVFTLDVGRVFMILSMGPLLLLITSEEVKTMRLLEHPLFRRTLVAGIAAGLIAPRIVVWDGKVHASVAYYSAIRFWKVINGIEQELVDPFHGLF